MPTLRRRDVTARRCLVLALVTVALAPVCVLLFGSGKHGGQAPSRAPAPTATASTTRGAISAGCVDRPLAYGLTNDQAAGQATDRAFLDPFAVHPQLPHPGFYGPRHGPHQQTLLHALYHGYVVVRYGAALARVVERDFGGVVAHAREPVVLVAGTGMPFAAGALVYGRTSICGKLDRTTIEQLTEWIRTARPGALRP